MPGLGKINWFFPLILIYYFIFNLLNLKKKIFFSIMYIFITNEKKEKGKIITIKLLNFEIFFFFQAFF
jgi:hypothetical protein